VQYIAIYSYIPHTSRFCGLAAQNFRRLGVPQSDIISGNDLIGHKVVNGLYVFHCWHIGQPMRSSIQRSVDV